MLSFVTMVVTSCCFFLASHREIAYSFHVSDDTGKIVDVFAVALRTFLQIVLAYVAALVADGVRDVECKVVASLLSGYLKKLCILCL
jgi:hypothetical protein